MKNLLAAMLIVFVSPAIAGATHATPAASPTEESDVDDGVCFGTPPAKGTALWNWCAQLGDNDAIGPMPPRPDDSTGSVGK